MPARTTDRRPISGEDLAIGSTQWDTDAGPIDVLVTAAGPNESIVVDEDIERGSVVSVPGGSAATMRSVTPDSRFILFTDLPGRVARARASRSISLAGVPTCTANRCGFVHTDRLLRRPAQQQYRSATVP